MKEITFEEKVKIAYLNNMLDKSIKLIHLAIKKLKCVKCINQEDYYFVFLYLSIGLELLIKIMISLKSYKDYNSFPTEEEMRSMGHDLDKLRKSIIKNYDEIPGSFLEKYQEIESDKKFISKDDMLIKLVKLIAQFAVNDRYFELNFITKKNIFKKRNDGKRIIDYSDAPIIKMNILVYKYVIKDHPSLANAKNFDDLNNPWLEANRLYIIPPLKKFIGALARQFVFGILGDEAIKCRSINTIKRYAYLKDYKVENKDLDKKYH